MQITILPGYIFCVPENEFEQMLDYLDEIGVDDHNYFYTTLPLVTTGRRYNDHGIKTYSMSIELDLLIMLKYGHYLVKKIEDGSVFMEHGGYNKYHLSGTQRRKTK